MLPTNAKIIKVSDTEIRISGTAEYFFEKYIYKTIDGEQYSRLKRDVKLVDFDLLWEKGDEFREEELPVFFKKVLGVEKIYFPKDYPNIFSRLSRCISENDYVQMYDVICDYFGITQFCTDSRYKYGYTRGNHRISCTGIEWNIMDNSFPITLFGYGNGSCSFYVMVPFEDIIKYDLLEMISEYETRHLPSQYSKLFLPCNNESEKTDRLIKFIEIRNELISNYEEKERKRRAEYEAEYGV